MSIMLRQTADMAAQQQAQLFCQETYKQSSEKSGGQAKSSVFKEIHVGNQNISGDFYGKAGVSGDRSNVQQYYGALYGAGNAGYQQFLAGSETGIAPQSVYPALSVSIYNNNFVTPSNFGIPYVDQNFATAAFKWNTAMLFGQPDKQGGSYQYYNVPNSGTGGQNNRPYIDYSGYRIYVGDATRITNITYYVCDTSDASNGNLFQDLTNIDPANLTSLHAGASGGYADQMALITQTSGVSPYLKYLTVAKIDYEVEVGYEGLTPLARAIKYINGYRVGGLDGQGATPSGNNVNFDQTQQLNGTVYYWLVA